jgi:hypothetical protein
MLAKRGVERLFTHSDGAPDRTDTRSQIRAATLSVHSGVLPPSGGQWRTRGQAPDEVLARWLRRPPVRALSAGPDAPRVQIGEGAQRAPLANRFHIVGM